jgi:beta-barrel assembly-enhancing protease
MTEFDILLFSPHHPAAGEKARAGFELGRLLINGQPIDVALDQIGLTLGGFDHKQVFLFWHSEQDGREGRWAITPANAQAQAQLQAEAPPPLSELLMGASRDISRQRRRSRFGVGALGAFLLLPLILLGVLFWQSHNIAGWIAGYISIGQEQQLGDLAFKQATAGLKLRQSGLDAAAVRDIGQRLTRGSKYNYQWFLAEDPAINAFAVPGGYVVVNTGLIRAADSAEEVAGVLAHEVQHVERRHTLKNLLHSLGFRALLALVVGDFSGTALGDAAATLSELKFGRDLESEADTLGLNALKQAGIAPQGMASFFAKLAKQEQGLAPPALLSTHPASEDRMQTLNKLIQEQGQWQSSPLPYDWVAIKATSN